MEDIATRDQSADADFSMTIGKREYSGKAARTNAGDGLNTVALSWRDSKALEVRGHFKGFDIMTRGSAIKDAWPELFIRGKQTYTAHLNFDNPLGTISSIESALRHLDKHADDEQRDVERMQKTLNDYRTQMNRTFDHEARLKELVAKQAELNALLDLDKHDIQAVGDSSEQPKEAEPVTPRPFEHLPTVHIPAPVMPTPVQALSAIAPLRRSTAAIGPSQ